MTLKQKLFIKTYLESFNATEAAFTVYKVNDRNVAGVIGYENLRKPKIQEEIQRLLTAGGLDLESVIQNLARIANAKVDRVSGETKLKANLELLKLRGLI